MASISERKPKIYFMLGRMNPPTPGHLEMIKLMSLVAYNNDAKARVYLTNSYNYKPKTKKPLQVLKEITDYPKKRGSSEYNIKKADLQNPLFPEQKKYFLDKMIKKIGLQMLILYLMIKLIVQ